MFRTGYAMRAVQLFPYRSHRVEGLAMCGDGVPSLKAMPFLHRQTALLEPPVPDDGFALCGAQFSLEILITHGRVLRPRACQSLRRAARGRHEGAGTPCTI